jgi:HEAT repeats
MRGRRSVYLLLLALGLQPLAGWKKPAPPSQISIAPDSAARLTDRFVWAARQTTPPVFAKGYWIGYSVQRLMGEHSYIGSWHGWSGRPEQNEPTIEYLISVKIHGEPAKRPDDDILREAARKALEEAERKEAPERQVRKEIGIFLKFGPGPRPGPLFVELSDLALNFDFEGLPLLWLGSAPNGESISVLENLYRTASGWDRKREFISAISNHQEPRSVIPFLDGVLRSDAPPAIREEAADGLGEQDDAQAVPILRRIIRSDASSGVRESAVSALAEMSRPEALDLLIETARKAPDKGLRREAVHGLAEKASEKIGRASGRTVFDANETEVQRQAVEVMSELPPAEALPALARIAETHANPEIRRAAVEALGDLEDPAAVTILIRLINK